MGFGWQHVLLIAVVVLLLFGRGKISDLMSDTAKGIKAFKKGLADDDVPAANSGEATKSIDNQPGVPAGEAQRTKAG